MWFVLLSATPTHVVNSIQYSFVNVAVVLRSWLTAYVGRCRYDGFLETETQLFRECLVGDADADTTILSNQVWCKIDCAIQNQCGWLCLYGRLFSEFSGKVTVFL